jgi:hypothetical protein
MNEILADLRRQMYLWYGATVNVPSRTPVEDTLKELDWAIEHNKGVPLGQSSQFTSWSKQKRVAEIFAGHGGN